MRERFSEVTEVKEAKLRQDNDNQYKGYNEHDKEDELRRAMELDNDSFIITDEERGLDSDYVHEITDDERRAMELDDNDLIITDEERVLGFEEEYLGSRYIKETTIDDTNSDKEYTENERLAMWERAEAIMDGKAPVDQTEEKDISKDNLDEVDFDEISR